MDGDLSWPMIGAFLAASVILAVTPGPGVLYIVTRSLAQGRRAGMASVAGLALGNFGNVLGAVFGLGLVFAASTTAFTIVKYAGAIYLIWLGLRALRASAPPVSLPGLATQTAARIFRDGVFVALLNPKTTLFFASFLPQFMSGEHPVWAQGLLFGSTFVLIALLTDTVYALGAGALAPRLANRRSLAANARYAAGGIFLGLGLFTALSSRGPH